MIKAVFFDIDGTLVDFETRTLSDSTKKALDALQANGIKRIVCTGRPISHLSFLPDAFYHYPFDGYVTYSGQICCDEKMKIFYKNTWRKESIRRAVSWILEKDVLCSVGLLDRTFDTKVNTYRISYLTEMNKLHLLPKVEDPRLHMDEDIFQMSPYIPASQDQAFLDYVGHVKGARWGGRFMDVFPDTGGKANGMDQMLAYFGLSLEQTMAFGDGGNDIEMLEHAHIGIAMGNADPQVKSHADMVTDSIHEDGIYKALKHFEII